jgi:hypothetical protein
MIHCWFARLLTKTLVARIMGMAWQADRMKSVFFKDDYPALFS